MACLPAVAKDVEQKKSQVLSVKPEERTLLHTGFPSARKVTVTP